MHSHLTLKINVGKKLAFSLVSLLNYLQLFVYKSVGCFQRLVFATPRIRKVARAQITHRMKHIHGNECHNQLKHAPVCTQKKKKMKKKLFNCCRFKITDTKDSVPVNLLSQND